MITMCRDVLAISLETKRVRILAEDETVDDAKAIVTMAVIRRGVEEEFFSHVKTGSYKNGELWKGKR